MSFIKNRVIVYKQKVNAVKTIHVADTEYFFFKQINEAYKLTYVISNTKIIDKIVFIKTHPIIQNK